MGDGNFPFPAVAYSPGCSELTPSLVSTQPRFRFQSFEQFFSHWFTLIDFWASLLYFVHCTSYICFVAIRHSCNRTISITYFPSNLWMPCQTCVRGIPSRLLIVSRNSGVPFSKRTCVKYSGITHASNVCLGLSVTKKSPLVSARGEHVSFWISASKTHQWICTSRLELYVHAEIKWREHDKVLQSEALRFQRKVSFPKPFGQLPDLANTCSDAKCKA